MFEHIDYSTNAGFAIIRLNRPSAMNALNAKLVRELGEAADCAASDAGVRTVILTGQPHFAAGADIKEMADLTPDQATAFGFNHTFSKIEALSKPTIAAISGYALGGGLELAMVCDFRIASRDAKLGFPEINLGIFPGAGGTQRLPRLIGLARAKEMIFQGTMIDAEMALQVGLVNEIADDVLEAAKTMAARLSTKAPIAVKLAKRAIQCSQDGDLRSGLDLEGLAWATLFSTEDQREGMRAFIEKRKPKFQGK